jgi:signal peptidase II
MKGRIVALIIILIVVADQALKFFIKTHYVIGESHEVLGSFFKLLFVENEGMAYGWKFGGDIGKLLLTLFRLGAVIFGVFYLRTIIEKKYHPGFIVCAALIFAGALGNLIDSMFYGIIFNDSSYITVANFLPKGGGYASFLHGKVVDMFSFSIFPPIFNLADASISTGVIAILVFQKWFFKKEVPKEPEHALHADSGVSDNMNVG